MIPYTLVVTISIFIQPPVSLNMNPLDARTPEYRTEYLIERFSSKQKCEAAKAMYEQPNYFASKGGLNGLVTAGGECIKGSPNRRLI